MTTTTPPTSRRPSPQGGKCGEFTVGVAAIVALLIALTRRGQR